MRNDLGGLIQRRKETHQFFSVLFILLQRIVKGHLPGFPLSVEGGIGSQEGEGVDFILPVFHQMEIDPIRQGRPLLLCQDIVLRRPAEGAEILMKGCIEAAFRPGEPLFIHPFRARSVGNGIHELSSLFLRQGNFHLFLQKGKKRRRQKHMGKGRSQPPQEGKGRTALPLFLKAQVVKSLPAFFLKSFFPFLHGSSQFAASIIC